MSVQINLSLHDVSNLLTMVEAMSARWMASAERALKSRNFTHVEFCKQQISGHDDLYARLKDQATHGHYVQPTLVVNNSKNMGREADTVASTPVRAAGVSSLDFPLGVESQAGFSGDVA